MNLWDIKAHLYHFFRKPWPLSWILERETKVISDLLKAVPVSNGKALDVACGNGHSTKLINNSFKIYAVDISKNMLVKTREFSSNISVSNAIQLPFSPGSFDLILCVGLSEYIKNLPDLRDEFLKVLKPNGCLILSSSPQNLYGKARIIGGSKLFLRDSYVVSDCFTSNGFKKTQHHHLFSMDAFLFQKISQVFH